MTSDAVGLERISRIVGYKITKGDFRETSPNLPQRIVILAEANNANQGDLSLEPTEITTAQQAGELYGYGSPVHGIMRILRPVASDGVGGIPTIVIAQAAAVGAAFKTLIITPAGVATRNGTHTLVIAGRKGVDGVFYNINVEAGDNVADLTDKVRDAVNAVLGSPMSAVSTDYEATLTSKWKGLTANEITVSVDTGEDDLGLNYVVSSGSLGSGTPSVQAALDKIGNQWATIVINSYGTHAGTMDTLEVFNGIPDPTSPTGRYGAVVWKPFIAFTGSTDEDPSSVTDARKNEVTIAICPAPESDGFQYEAAANMCVVQAPQAQNNPQLDAAGMSYPDMPTPTSIGAMATYTNRDAIVKKGCSTVDLVAERYQVQDFVTTYHKDGEVPPQFRYVRNLVIDMNVRYTYFVMEQESVVDHMIAADEDVVTAEKVIKPKDLKQKIYSMADDLVSRGLTTQSAFMQKSITVSLGTGNPDRLESFFRYKRSGFGRVLSTTGEAGFSFGNV